MDKSLKQQIFETCGIRRTKFISWDYELVVGSYLLFEDETRWLQFTEIGEEEIKGRFQATCVKNQGAKFFIDLPIHFGSIMWSL